MGFGSLDQWSSGARCIQACGIGVGRGVYGFWGSGYIHSSIIIWRRNKDVTTKYSDLYIRAFGLSRSQASELGIQGPFGVEPFPQRGHRALLKMIIFNPYEGFIITKM